MKMPFAPPTALLLLPFLFCAITPASQALEIDAEARGKLGLATAPLKECTIPRTSPAFGTVLSPAPLIDLLRQRDTAIATAGFSKEALARAEKLFASGELVARKDVDAARAQQVQDEAQIRGLEDRITLEWGPAFAAMSSGDQASFIAELLDRKRFLARIALPGRKWPEAAPTGATFHPGGAMTKPFHSAAIYQSTTTDPAFQSLSFLTVFESPGISPTPGTADSATLELPGEPEHGLLVPESAVVFFQARAWIYSVHGSGDEFQRIEISTDHPAPGGWCVAKEKIGTDEVVTTGAQVLLSEEALSAHPAEED
ncbi:efflux RND transporter periplasmic adaptor subunit [Haloferula sp. BvORR071]|uniref:efflux RND transporter periplasmic adaptor subunit n=1 Tax=Haloferula sp. BvORR071 TaxID=1396141 RepID=UPI00069735FF|nr:efflux RND transporter periplasmic adaptor subunit [Haloferula sp. BvORR071]